MKILCLVTILANLVFLLWEYRQGAFNNNSQSVVKTEWVQTDKQIVLASEMLQFPQPSMPGSESTPQLEPDSVVSTDQNSEVTEGQTGEDVQP